MSSRGSGHAPGNQEPHRIHRSTPQAYHEDSYHRSSRHETSDDETSRLRAGRFARIPGLTPHHDPFRHMPSIASQFPGSSTVIAQAGPDVGVDPFSGPRAHRRRNNLNAYRDEGDWRDAEVQDPSWSHRPSAEPERSTFASPGGHLYPQTLEIPLPPPTRIHEHHGPAARPMADQRNAVPFQGPAISNPQGPQQPVERSRPYGSNVRTSPQHQQRRSANGYPSIGANDHVNYSRHTHSGPPRRPQDP